MKQLLVIFILSSILSRSNAQKNTECFNNLNAAATEIKYLPYISDKLVFNSSNILEKPDPLVSFKCIGQLFQYDTDKEIYTFRDTSKNSYPLNSLIKFRFNSYIGFIFHSEFFCSPRNIVGHNELAFFDSIGKMVYYTMVPDYRYDTLTGLFSTYHSFIVDSDYIIFFESNTPQNSRIKCIINCDEQNAIHKTEFDIDDNQNLDSILQEFNINKIDFVSKSPNNLDINSYFFEDAIGYIPLQIFKLKKTFITHSWGTKVVLDSVESYLIARYKILATKDDKAQYLNIFINNLHLSGFNSAIEVYGAEENLEGRNIETFLIADYFESNELNNITTGKLNVNRNTLTISNKRGEKRYYRIEIQ